MGPNLKYILADCTQKICPFEDFHNLAIRNMGIQPEGGALISLQRLWSMALAAIEGQNYHGILTQTEAEMSVLRDVVLIIGSAIVEHFRKSDILYEVNTSGRYMLCVDYLPFTNKHGSHLNLICSYAAALASLESTTAILILMTGETLPERNGMTALDMEGDESMWQDALRRVAKPESLWKIKFFTPPTVGAVRPLESSFNAAMAFRPSVVVYFLGILASRLMPRLLNGQCPQIAIQMNAACLEPQDCDLVLAGAISADFSLKPTPSLWRVHSVPMVPLAATGGQRTKLDASGSLTIVTALGFARIERALRNDGLAAQIASFLHNNADICWVFVGVSNPDQFANEVKILQKLIEARRVIFVEHEPCLRQLYRECDIYFHLPGAGGGGMGIAMAIAEAIPVIAERGTDAESYIHDVGLYESTDEAFTLVKACIESESLRVSIAQSQLRSLNEFHSIQAAAVSLHKLLPDAFHNFYTKHTLYPN